MWAPQIHPPRFLNGKLLGDNDQDLTPLFKRKDLPDKIMYTLDGACNVVVIVNFKTK